MNKNLAKIITVSTLAIGVFVHNNQEVSAAVDSVVRIEGANRFETSTLISKEGFEKADVVLIANAREFADALAGVPLAYQKDAPILLAQGNRLNQVIIEEINRLGAKQAIILGGEVAVNRELENHIKSLGLSTSRIAGQNRFETSDLIADELLKGQSSNNAVVVDGFEFADAMSIAPFAAQAGMPIYLTRTSSLSTKDSLKDFDQTYIIGGENAVSKQVESELNNPIRLAGANRYETNIEVLDYFDIDSNNLFVATGLDFADALTGAVLAANNNTGVGLVRGAVGLELSEFIQSNSIRNIAILGGKTAVNESISAQLTKDLIPKDNEGNVEVIFDLYYDQVGPVLAARMSFNNVVSFEVISTSEYSPKTFTHENGYSYRDENNKIIYVADFYLTESDDTVQELFIKFTDNNGQKHEEIYKIDNQFIQSKIPTVTSP